MGKSSRKQRDKKSCGHCDNEGCFGGKYFEIRNEVERFLKVFLKLSLTFYIYFFTIQQFILHLTTPRVTFSLMPRELIASGIDRECFGTCTLHSLKCSPCAACDSIDKFQEKCWYICDSYEKQLGLKKFDQIKLITFTNRICFNFQNPKNTRQEL